MIKARCISTSEKGIFRNQKKMIQGLSILSLLFIGKKLLSFLKTMTKKYALFSSL